MRRESQLGGGHRVRSCARKHVRIRRRLEPTGAPAAIKIETLDWRFGDQWARVWANIDDTGPAANHTDTAENWEKIGQSAHLMFDDIESTALRIGIEEVSAGTNDQFTLIRLAEINMHGARHENRVHDRLQRLRDEGLQGMAFDR